MKTTAPSLALVATLLAALLLLATLLPGHPMHRAGTAHACSIASIDVRESMLRRAPLSDLVIIGTVTDERTYGRAGDSTLYVSTVRTDAMLKGEADAESISIPLLGQLGGDCSGGPRLREGERVLLLLDWQYTARSGDGSIEYAWQFQSIFGKVLIAEGTAIAQEIHTSEPLGEANATIRAFGEAVGAGESRIEAVIIAANADEATLASGRLQDGGSDNRAWAIPLTVAVMALAALIGARRWWRRRDDGASP